MRLRFEAWPPEATRRFIEIARSIERHHGFSERDQGHFRQHLSDLTGILDTGIRADEREEFVDFVLRQADVQLESTLDRLLRASQDGGTGSPNSDDGLVNTSVPIADDEVRAETRDPDAWLVEAGERAFDNEADTGSGAAGSAAPSDVEAGQHIMLIAVGLANDGLGADAVECVATIVDPGVRGVAAIAVALILAGEGLGDDAVRVLQEAGPTPMADRGRVEVAKILAGEGLGDDAVSVLLVAGHSQAVDKGRLQVAKMLAEGGLGSDAVRVLQGVQQKPIR